MIKKLQRKDAVELLKRIYAGSHKRTLIVDDGSASGWRETDSFPKMGGCEVLIKDVQVPEILSAFIAVLRDYYANRSDETFFYLEEESVAGRESAEIESDLNSLSTIVDLEDNGPNLNSVLFDASFTWALKLHHESFGYFSGTEELCDRLRKSNSLSHLVLPPIWSAA